MVQINVSQQLNSPIGTTRDYDMSGIIDMDGYDNTIDGKVRLMRTDRGILVRGTINTESELSCSRCLSPYDYRCTLNIEEEYFPTRDIVNGGPLPTPDEPGTFTIDEYNILDLTEAIRQYTVLTSPMKPLCSQDCAGLCPTCGVNLNRSSCGCPRKPLDPRWDKISKLVLTGIEIPAKEQKGTK